MAFKTQFPNSISVTGIISSTEDCGPSAASGKKCKFIIVNPSLSKKKFDTFIHGYSYGINAVRMLHSKGELISIEGRLGSERGKNIVLVDTLYWPDDDLPKREDE